MNNSRVLCTDPQISLQERTVTLKKKLWKKRRANAKQNAAWNNGCTAYCLCVHVLAMWVCMHMNALNVGAVLQSNINNGWLLLWLVDIDRCLSLTYHLYIMSSINPPISSLFQYSFNPASTLPLTKLNSKQAYSFIVYWPLCIPLNFETPLRRDTAEKPLLKYFEALHWWQQRPVYTSYRMFHNQIQAILFLLHFLLVCPLTQSSCLEVDVIFTAAPLTQHKAGEC